MRLIVIACALMWLSPGPTAAAPKAENKASHCLGHDGPRMFVSQAVMGRPRPRMLAALLEFTSCYPLIRKPGILYSLTNYSAGAVMYLSPVVNAYGGFISVTPLSFVTIRFDALYTHHWTLPGFSGAGYMKLPSYDAAYDDESLSKLKGRRASGVLLQGRLTLRGRVSLSPRVRVVLLSELVVDYWRFDQTSYYKNIPRDVVLAHSDIVLVDTTTLLVEFRMPKNASLFIGPQYDFTYVPNHRHQQHLLTAIAAVRFDRVGKIVKNLRAFIQLGSYLRHAFRAGAIFTGAGVALDYDLNR